MDNVTNSSVKWILYAALLAWVAVLMAQKIDLTGSDVGRHITNGSMILRSAADRDAVLHTNFYSYTMPNQPFINHHWLTGVVFYLIWKSFGFAGLTVCNILLGLITFSLFFDLARRAGGFWLALAIGIVVRPLITLRFDMRPENFTYLFTGIFAWTLWRYRAGKVERRWLYALPALMLLWVNLHIGFVFGFMVLGAFVLDALVLLAPAKVTQNRKTRDSSSRTAKSGKRSPRSSAIEGNAGAALPETLPARRPDEWKRLAAIGGICALAGLVNPNFIRGFLYPLFIFSSYGYTIFENQSIPFIEQLGLAANQPFLLFELTAAAVILSCIGAGIKNLRKLDIALLTPAFVTGIMAWLAVRHFVIAALFSLPALASTIAVIRGSPSGKRSSRDWILIPIAAVAVALTIWQQYQLLPQFRPTLGLGVLPGVDASADFFDRNHIAGPIFNDYDIGGYLIYKLSGNGPGQRVFVDNRPEAYTVEFFQNVYIPAQQDEERWRQLDNQYHFNVIFFSHRDSTPWGRTFLVARAKDSAWAPVFADAYNIIFLRRDNPGNAEIIRRYAIAVRITN